MKEIRHYTGRVPPQHKKPKFIEWLKTNLTTVSEAERLVISYDYEFDIDNAVGVQLDALGDIVGRQRLLSFQPSDGSNPLLDDDMYRIVLKAKISINHWDGTIPGMYELWANLFPEYKIFIQDNQNMTMTVYLEGYAPDLLIDLVINDYIIPRPEGVGIIIVLISLTETDDKHLSVGGISNALVSETTLEEELIELTMNVYICGAAAEIFTVTELPLID